MSKFGNTEEIGPEVSIHSPNSSGDGRPYYVTRVQDETVFLQSVDMAACRFANANMFEFGLGADFPNGTPRTVTFESEQITFKNYAIAQDALNRSFFSDCLIALNIAYIGQNPPPFFYLFGFYYFSSAFLGEVASQAVVGLSWYGVECDVLCPRVRTHSQ
jgi:hypothetical protein